MIFSKTPGQNIYHIRKRLLLLYNDEATLQRKKRNSFTDTVNYLGHVLCSRRLVLASHTSDAIHGFNPSTSLTKLRFFLGTCNVFKRFVPNFARIASLLNQRLEKKNQPRTPAPLNSEELHVMDTTKSAFIAPPKLAFPYSGGHVTADTDGWNVQIGFILLQKQPDDRTKPLACRPCSLTDTEQQCYTRHRKFQAIVWSALLLHPYFKRQRFTIRTDQDALRRILNLPDPTKQLVRWRVYLSEFYFNVIHRAGIKLRATDALSQFFTTDKDESRLEIERPFPSIDYVMNANISDKSGNRNDHRFMNIHNTEPNTDNPTNDPLTLVKLTQMQKNDVFWKPVPLR